MNRVYPLREGSGECYALVDLDAVHSCEFRRGRQKISFRIISLLKKVYRPRDSAAKVTAGSAPARAPTPEAKCRTHRPTAPATAATPSRSPNPARAGDALEGLQQAQHQAQRDHAGAVRVANVEVLIFEPAAEL